MYTFKASELEDKVRYAKPYSFFENIRHKINKKGNTKFLSLEETIGIEIKDFDEFSSKINDKLQKKHIEETYGNITSYLSNVYSKVQKARNRLNASRELQESTLTESYNVNVFQEKAKKDLVFMRELLEFAFDSEDKAFDLLKKEIFEMTQDVLLNTVELYQETNTKPRYISLSLNQKELSESEIFDLYMNNFKKFLTENYVKPVIKKELNENDLNDIKEITRLITENGINANLDEISLYVPFEKRIKEFLENVFIPEHSKRNIQLFIESNEDIYFEMFEKNAKVLMENIDVSISKIASLLAPFLFNKVVDGADIENPVKYASVSLVCKKINNGPMVCKKTVKGDTGDTSNTSNSDDSNKLEDDSIESDDDIDNDILDEELKNELKAEADAEIIDDVLEDEKEDNENKEDKEDKDKDDVPDKEEDHGKLPDDFKGDHKKAEKEKEKELNESSNTIQKTEDISTDIPHDVVSPNIKTVKSEFDVPNDRNRLDPELWKKANEEEVIPDESVNYNKIDDAGSTRENFDPNFGYKEN